eukprot:7349679-Karenia_brevis.AAC.1
MQQQLQQQQELVATLQAEITALRTQCGHLLDLLGDRFTAGHALPAFLAQPAFSSSHASPALIDDSYDSEDSIATADHTSPVLLDAATQVVTDPMAMAAGHAPPVLFDIFAADDDQLQCGHLSIASPVLCDAACQ